MKALKNQKWFRLLFILALSLMLTAGALVVTSAVVTAQEQELTTVATTARLNLREEPGLTASVIRVLDAGEEVQLTGFKNEAGDWVQVVTSDNETGWVAAEFLTPAPDVDALEVFQVGGDDDADTGDDASDNTGDDTTGDDEPVFSSDVVTATTTVNLNLRETPSLSAAILDVLPAGTVVGFTGFTDATGQWVQVDAADGPVGWVSAQFLSNVPSGLQELGATDDADDASDDTGADDDSAAGDDTDDEPVFSSDVVTATTTANVNLRAMPGLDATILQVLPLGSVVGFTGFTDATGQWVQVDPADGPVGWVAASLLSFVPDGLQDVSQATDDTATDDDSADDTGDTSDDDSAFAPDADTASTTVNLNLRNEPSLSGTVITTLPAGTMVAFTGFMTEAGDWVQVETASGQIGWVSAQFLDNVPDDLEVWQGDADDGGDDNGDDGGDGS